MKKGLMTQFPYARGRAFVCKNIGDYIQSVATRQFIDHVDEYIEQEEADKYFPEDKQKIRLIMNGWFQWRSENWPPSEYIYPLLISMHISPLKAGHLLTPEGISFLKRYSPVGCRDYYTQNLLEAHGIPAYFSACMTLTLGKKYRVPDNQHKGVCVVDPYFEIPPAKSGIKNFVKAVFAFLRHMPGVLKLGRKEFFRVYSPSGFLDRSRSRLRPYYKAALFLDTYSKKFDVNMLLNAKYITHWLDVDMSGSTKNDDLLNYAESLVRTYASAGLVITSRIHAGLPCLAMDTPVVFIENREVVADDGRFNVPGRLGGLLDFFRRLVLEDGLFTTEDEVFKNIDKFGEHTLFKNKNNWRPYAKTLADKASSFMSDTD
ncbi:MAG: polysaccharide pyruvyl transferase family protein [Synergistaceae bacterium]|nr:polysaccharide pyruvyl transferase family protein [Synergistaceae bacterium]